MFWRVTGLPVNEEELPGDERSRARPDGRFVVHRHVDQHGPHLDLRLECGEHLVGWRIDGLRLEDDLWATEKGPHPIRWLEQDGDAVREDAGLYTWLERSSDRRVLLLKGGHKTRLLRLEQEPGLPPRVVRSICAALKESGLSVEQAGDVGRLVRDGLTARQRAVERLCGLGRELDESAFDETVWRKALSALTLEEVHTQLRTFEIRFDEKYPPEPVSRPERLPASDGEARETTALAILGEGFDS